MTIKAWHFTRRNRRLGHGDGRLVRAGSVHTVDGVPDLCKYGLHGSVRAIDALRYAPGPDPRLRLAGLSAPPAQALPAEEGVVLTTKGRRSQIAALPAPTDSSTALATPPGSVVLRPPGGDPSPQSSPPGGVAPIGQGRARS